jgi:hypothetical protein
VILSGDFHGSTHNTNSTVITTLSLHSYYIRKPYFHDLKRAAVQCFPFLIGTAVVCEAQSSALGMCFTRLAAVHEVSLIVRAAVSGQ